MYALLLSCVRLFETIWTVTRQTPLSMGFFRQEYYNEWPCPPPGDLPDPGIEPMSPMPPTLQADSLPTEPWGKTMVELIRNDFSNSSCNKNDLSVCLVASNTTSVRHLRGYTLCSLCAAKSCLGHDTSMRNIQIWKENRLSLDFFCNHERKCIFKVSTWNTCALKVIYKLYTEHFAFYYI